MDFHVSEAKMRNLVSLSRRSSQTCKFETESDCEDPMQSRLMMFWRKVAWAGSRTAWEASRMGEEVAEDDSLDELPPPPIFPNTLPMIPFFGFFSGAADFCCGA